MTMLDVGQLMALPAGDRRDALAWLYDRCDGDEERDALLACVTEQLGTAMGVYVDSPALFATDVLGTWLSAQQRRVADALAQHRKVAVPSGHDLGKSWLAARLVAWWIECHPPGEARVVSTAPTFNQVKGVLWREIARAHVEGSLSGKLNQTEWWLTTAFGTYERVAQGRKPADNATGGFQGEHERYVLVVIDEADEVHPSIWEGVDTIVTNEHSKVVAIGNPVSPTSEFARVCHRTGADPDWSGDYTDQGWWLERLDGLASPNFTDEVVPERVRDLLLSRIWVEDYARKHGRDSMAFNSRVRGQHPTEVADGVVPLGWLRDRCQHWVEPDDDDVDTMGRVPQPPDQLWTAQELLPWELGIDVGAGSDQTVVWARAGRRAIMRWDTRSRDPRDTHALIVEACKWVADQGGTLTAIKIDVIGWGWGVYGSLLEDRDKGVIGTQVDIVPVNVGAAAITPDRFKNLRSQLWWDVGRGLTEDGVWDLSQVSDEVVMQLAEPRYTTDASGRVVVEKKADTSKRIGHSPDDADALLLAYVTLPAEVRGYILQETRATIE